MQTPTPDADLDALEGLAWYIQRRPVFTGGNEVRLLHGGQELFPTLRDRIDAAQHSVWMAFYIISPLGQSGWVLQALMRAARRGVSVHLVVDGLGSRDAPASLWEDLTQAGDERDVLPVEIDHDGLDEPRLDTGRPEDVGGGERVDLVLRGELEGLQVVTLQDDDAGRLRARGEEARRLGREEADLRRPADC